MTGTIFAVIVVAGGVFLFCYLFPKMRKNGDFLKSEVRPLYNRIMYYVEPYIGCDFAMEIRETALSELEHIYKNKDSSAPVYKYIIDNAKDNSFLYDFAWLYIFYALNHSHPPLIRPSDEELHAKRELHTRIIKLLNSEIDNLPKILLDYFQINKEDIKEEL